MDIFWNNQQKISRVCVIPVELYKIILKSRKQGGEYGFDCDF